MRRAISITVLSTLAGFAQAEGASSFDCHNFLQFGGDVTKTRALFDQGPETLTWNWFSCLNQPAASNNPNRLWETFKPSDQVYLVNGAKPAPYNSGGLLPPPVSTQAKALGMNSSRIMHNINAVQQVDGMILEMGGDVPDAVKGKPVRFQLLMSQDTFNYIVQKQVYNVNGQQALTSNLDFPPTAWELKASWLWIGADTTFQNKLQADGYYIAQAYYQENGRYVVGYAALSGLHVVNKLKPDWVWTTFENVNNSKYTVTNAIPPTPMTNSTGPTMAAAEANRSFQPANPTLSKYELIGTQYEPLPTKALITPKLLANSQLESAFQSQSSCLACHDTAAYSKTRGYFNFARKEQGGIVYPTAKVPPQEFADYKKLDYVWSLKRAHWQR